MPLRILLYHNRTGSKTITLRENNVAITERFPYNVGKLRALYYESFNTKSRGMFIIRCLAEWLGAHSDFSSDALNPETLSNTFKSLSVDII